MTPGFSSRVRAIDWTRFATAYGPANDVPIQLLQLASTDHATAMAATHQLWCGLCHQHAYISSAALPAFPLLLEILRSANEKLTVELLDIFTGFAVCSTHNPDGLSSKQWQRELRQKMNEELPIFVSLTQHENEEIVSLAKMIVEYLAQNME